MRKLKLAVEELQVEAFTTATARSRRGTVAGRESDTDPSFCGDCGGCPTVDPNNAYCTFENCSAWTWCPANCSYGC